MEMMPGRIISAFAAATVLTAGVFAAAQSQSQTPARPARDTPAQQGDRAASPTGREVALWLGAVVPATPPIPASHSRSIVLRESAGRGTVARVAEASQD